MARRVKMSEIFAFDNIVDPDDHIIEQVVGRVNKIGRHEIMNNVIQMQLPSIKYVSKKSGHRIKPLIFCVLKKCPKCGNKDAKLDYSIDPPNNRTIVN
jgi:hypothetical protein